MRARAAGSGPEASPRASSLLRLAPSAACGPGFLALARLGALLVAGWAASGCGDSRWVQVPGTDGALKSTAEVRAERRLYDGAPPVIPHALFGADCSACHDDRGIAVEGVGYAPPSPHAGTSEAGATTRCRQCHVPVETDRLFVESTFAGLEQDLRPGGRLYPGAPPILPHPVFMRENCAACHAGPGAREEIRTTHPARDRCRQCHVPVTTREIFSSTPPGGQQGRESP